MPQTTVFIASRTEQENYILEKKLESLEYDFKDVKFSSVHIAGLLVAIDRLTAAIILNLTEWTPKEAIMLQEIRRVGFNGPILITAKADPTVVNRDIRGMSGVIFLAKPFDAKELLGISKKMLLARAVPQQRFKRYTTSQEAQIEVDSTGASLAMRVRNLSKGGAYLEFIQPNNIQIGELVTVTLELKDLQRKYTMPARVIWTNKHGNRGLGVGVEFTGRGDVQRSILGY